MTTREQGQQSLEYSGTVTIDSESWSEYFQ